MQKLECPQCDAAMKVPETGLTMTCEFCGFEAPVPDAEERREDMEAEAKRQERLKVAKREQAEREARKAEEKKKENRRKTGQAILSAPGKLIGALLPFVGLLIPAIILYQNGMFDSYIGDAGNDHYLAAATQLAAAGHTPATKKEVIGVGGFSDMDDDIFQQLHAGYCYTFVVGSGSIISSVTVTNPKGKEVLDDEARGYSKMVDFCPKVSGLFGYHVTLLNQNGRYTYSLYYRPAPHNANRRN